MTENANKKITIKPYSKKMIVAEIVLLIFEAVFVALLLMVNLLPLKLLVPIIGVIVVIDIIIMMMLGNRRVNKRLLGLIIAIVVACVSCMGSWYLFSTYSAFAKILDFGQYEYYDVVVLDEAKYEEIEQIRGQTVYVLPSNLKTYEEAKGKLGNTVEINYEEQQDMMAVGSKLVEENGMTHDNIIFISDSNYGIICDEIEGYKKATRVLYQVKVETKTSDAGSNINVTEDSFNIYVSGIDVWGEIEQVSRSDVNMIVTVNPKTRQILLTSIPRDAYVQLHSFGQMDKLTHSGVYGIDETLLTIEDWLGVHSEFYVRANFNMIIKLVDAVHGIKVYSDYDFKSSISDYEYQKGWNRLSGKRALYFARERKCFEDNDQERVKNQQKVVKALVSKITQSDVILTNYTGILDAVAGYMQTDLPKRDLSALVKMQLNDMETPWTINSISIEGTMGQEGTYSMGMGRPLDVCLMNEDSVERAKKLINEVMYPADDQVVVIQDDKSKNGVKGSN